MRYVALKSLRCAKDVLYVFLRIASSKDYILHVSIFN